MKDKYEIDLNREGKEMTIDDFDFNAEPFIDKYMAQVSSEIRMQEEDGVVKAILSIAVGVDEKRVKKWLERAKMLDEIDKSNLIDIAVSKKIGQLKNENKRLRKQNQHLTEIIDGYERNWD